jgi:hypothetical protein
MLEGCRGAVASLFVLCLILSRQGHEACKHVLHVRIGFLLASTIPPSHNVWKING